MWTAGPPAVDAVVVFVGAIDECWILDVEGSRLVIVAGRAPGSPTGDVAEMRTLLESIEIEP